MVAGLKGYAEYRESGLPWLGVVPTHWQVLPNRAIFAEVIDRRHPDEEMLSVTITRGVIRQNSLLSETSKKDASNQDKSAYKLVQPGDIAYNKMRAWQGAFGSSTLRGIISPAYVVMRLRNANNDPLYFHNLFRSPLFAKEAERWSYGITSDMWSLRPEHFRMIYAPVPPPEEQAAIVRFLTWANARLDRALRAKRRIIALLNEQKQAIIQQAVTRGLDPSAPMRDSGVPWLGEIPAHWEVRRLKYLLRSPLKYGANEEARDVDERWPRYIRITDFGADGKLRSDTFRSLPPDVAKPYLLTEGDILFARSGATVGKSFQFKCYPGAACFAGYLIRATVNPSLAFSDFVYAYTKTGAFTKWKDGICIQATIQNIGADKYANLPVPVAPLNEQKQIDHYVKEASQPVEAAISRVEREIDLLREYRTRLTADVVTGKLDVREFAAALPETDPAAEWSGDAGDDLGGEADEDDEGGNEA